MDLSRFMHGGPGRLVACASCGVTLRDEAESANYAGDSYDPDLLSHLYPRYRAAFQEKETHYRGLLRPHAEVVEIGSHLGAFLETAEEWGWRPTGFDVGGDTTGFARRRGVRVQRAAIEDARFENRSADAVFIWNCFEQLEDPRATLVAARRLLRPHGLLVVRTPNFAYYESHRESAAQQGMRSTAGLRLAYHNLLGFPYLTGYTPRSLASLLARYGFETCQAVGAPLIVTPFPDLSRRLKREMASAYQPYHGSPVKSPEYARGPWIEIACRVAG